jgi:hypothetical protein
MRRLGMLAMYGYRVDMRRNELLARVDGVVGANCAMRWLLIRKNECFR